MNKGNHSCNVFFVIVSSRQHVSICPMLATIPCKYMRRYKVMEMRNAMTKNKFTQKEQMHHEAITDTQDNMSQKSQTQLSYLTNKEPISVDDDLDEHVTKLVALRHSQAASFVGS